ncbi:MAG: IS1 family transposase [Pyrinomonadaceae bacterium]
MNRLNRDKQVQIISLMVEGMGVNAITRVTNVSKNTVLKLLADLGTACANYQDAAFRNLTLTRLECDEIWSFCFAKSKNVPEEKRGILGFGDLWTWIAMDSVTKLVPCFHVGRRDAFAASEFINDLASRLKTRVQLTTDGHRAYLEAVESAFGSEIDYAQLIKLYGTSQDEVRYSPAPIVSTKKNWVAGRPNPKFISTSLIERQNLTVRMSSRRFTRLTNGHSKKLENHIHALSIHYCHYNFVRIHQTLRYSPAMAANITSRLWEISDMLDLLDSEYAGKVL